MFDLTLERKCGICRKDHFPTDDSEERICSSCYGGFDKFNSIETLLRAVFYLKFEYTMPTEETEDVVHGVDCNKAEHIGTGHLHSEDDDAPFDDDNVMYCGRCHFCLPRTYSWFDRSQT